MSNQGTPAGWEADGPPVRYTEGAPSAKIANTTFTPPADKKTVVHQAPSPGVANGVVSGTTTEDTATYAAAPASHTTSAPLPRA